MIPKKIHYCWFGGNPLPELANKCIDSWKKFCPDYEIIQWNESNFDVNCCDYIREAYEAKKWAFVSDYARFKILYEHGGLYFDTDVELIKSVDDLISKGNFMGIEETSVAVNPGLGAGASSNLNIYKELLDKYDSMHFLKPDGSYEDKTVVDYTTEVLLKYGFKKKNELQKISDIFIYPSEFFCPLNYLSGELTTTENTYSIHHYTASWYTETQKYSLELKKKYGQVLPRRMANVLAVAVAKIRCEGFKACLKWIFKQ